MVNKQHKLLSNVKANVPKESKKKNIKSKETKIKTKKDNKKGGHTANAENQTTENTRISEEALKAVQEQDNLRPELKAQQAALQASPNASTNSATKSIIAAAVSAVKINQLAENVRTPKTSPQPLLVAPVDNEKQDHLKLAEELNILLNNSTNQNICDNTNIDNIKIILEIIKNKFNDKGVNNTMHKDLFDKIVKIINCNSVNTPIPKDTTVLNSLSPNIQHHSDMQRYNN